MNSKPDSPIDIRQTYAGQLFPQQQAEVFRNIDKVFPVRRLPASTQPQPLQYDLQDLHKLSFQSQGQQYDIYDYISRNRISGLLLMKNDKVVFENYQLGNNESSRWTSMSIAKSIASTLVGVAINDGYIHHLDEPLLHYLPELVDGAYEDVTIRQLLLMSSGAQWNEDQTNPDSHRRQVLDLQIGQQAGSITEYMSRLPKLAEAGSRWNYSTGETHMVGSLIKAATGKWLSDYLAERIWQPLGMESGASWWLETDAGLEVAGSGFSACLRDYARFARFFMSGGFVNGQQILPKDWLHLAAGPTQIGDSLVPYGLMWWSLPDAQGDFSRRAFSGRGIFGQRIYMSPQDNSLAVVWCARSKPMGDEPINDNDFFNAFCQQK